MPKKLLKFTSTQNSLKIPINYHKLFIFIVLENADETDYHTPITMPSVIPLSQANDGTKTSKPKPNRRIRSKKKSKMNSIKRDEQIPDSDIYRCDLYYIHT